MQSIEPATRRGTETHSEPSSAPRLTIEVRGVHKRYRIGARTVEALRGLDLTVEGPGFVGVMGPSGSGKSTLLHLVAGLDRADDGSIDVAGTRVDTLPERDLTFYRRRSIGIVFQQFNLLPTLTALENVILPGVLDGGDRRATIARGHQLLNELGLDERADHRPDALSGGEQQRVAIARSLYFDPPVLLADEPTGNLDSATSDRLWDLLARVAEARSILLLLVTHEPSAASRCRSVHVLRDGALAGSFDVNGSSASELALRAAELSGRRGRSILLVAAVTLASALVVATSCGIATAEKSLEDGINRALGATDARVVQRYAGTFSADVLTQLRALPDVDAACGRLFGSLTLVRDDDAEGSDGRRQRITVQARGTDAPEHPKLREVELAQGHRPQADDEILLDQTSAEKLDAALGTVLRVERFGEPIRLKVVGIYKRPRLSALQRPVVELSRRALAAAGNREDEITSVVILLRKGTDVPAWVERHRSVVAAPLLLESADKVRTGLDRQLLAMHLGFVLAAAIAFLSCAFIVAVGLTTAVTEQQREMAIARCIGAARSQLFCAQLVVGAIISVIGGVLGIPVGIALASVLVRYWVDYLKEDTQISLIGLSLAIGGSVLAGLIGAAFPAWQASRVTPMAALTVRARPPRPRGLGLCFAIGLVCIATQLALLLVPNVQTRFWCYAIAGIALLHVGAFLLSPVFLVVVAEALGAAVAALARLPRSLLHASVRSMPYRLGFTAGALMVGVSVLVSLWTSASSLINEFQDRIRFADGFVTCTSGLDERKQAVIAALPGVEASCPVGYLPVRLAKGETLGVDGLGPTSVTCVGFDPERFVALNRLEFVRGSAADAIPKLRHGNAVLVAEEFLRARGLDVGDTIGFGGKEGDLRFEIAGVVSSAGLDVAMQFFGMRAIYMEHATSCVFMDFDAVQRNFGTRDAFIMQLRLDPTRDAAFDAELTRAIEEKVPGATYTSGRAIRAELDDIASTSLAITSAVAFSALLLACFGVGNVVAAGVIARRHEFGVLLAVGGSKGLLPRLVLAESLLMAITASIVGTSLGMYLAFMATLWHRDLGGLSTHLAFPWSAALRGWTATATMTLLAALPAALSLLRFSPRALLAARS